MRIFPSIHRDVLCCLVCVVLFHSFYIFFYNIVKLFILFSCTLFLPAYDTFSLLSSLSFTGFALSYLCTIVFCSFFRYYLLIFRIIMYDLCVPLVQLLLLLLLGVFVCCRGEFLTLCFVSYIA